MTKNGSQGPESQDSDLASQPRSTAIHVAVIGGIFTLLAAIVGGIIAIVPAIIDDEGESSDRTTASTGGAVDEEGDSSAYWTNDGSAPEASQACDGVLGFCLGQPIEAVRDDLGIEDSVYAGTDPGSQVSEWQLDGGGAHFTSDELGAIREAGIGTDGTLRASLPDGFELGEFAVRDLLQSRGQPHQSDVIAGEGFTVVLLGYCDGPEASILNDYSLSLDFGDDIGLEVLEEGRGDASPILWRIGDRPVTGYAVRDRGVSGVLPGC